MQAIGVHIQVLRNDAYIGLFDHWKNYMPMHSIYIPLCKFQMINVAWALIPFTISRVRLFTVVMASYINL